MHNHRAHSESLSIPAWFLSVTSALHDLLTIFDHSVIVGIGFAGFLKIPFPLTIFLFFCSDVISSERGDAESFIQAYKTEFGGVYRN